MNFRRAAGRTVLFQYGHAYAVLLAECKRVFCTTQEKIRDIIMCLRHDCPVTIQHLGCSSAGNLCCRSRHWQATVYFRASYYQTAFFTPLRNNCSLNLF